MGEQTDWIEWAGGKCPVEPRVTVKVKLQNGRQVSGMAMRFFWSHDDVAHNHKILAYLIVKS